MTFLSHYLQWLAGCVTSRSPLHPTACFFEEVFGELWVYRCSLEPKEEDFFSLTLHIVGANEVIHLTRFGVSTFNCDVNIILQCP